MTCQVKEYLDEVKQNARVIEQRYSKNVIATALSTAISHLNVMMHDEESTKDDFRDGAENTYELIKSVLARGVDVNAVSESKMPKK